MSKQIRQCAGRSGSRPGERCPRTALSDGDLCLSCRLRWDEADVRAADVAGIHNDMREAGVPVKRRGSGDGLPRGFQFDD